MFMMYFIHNFLTNIINSEVLFVGYLCVMDMSNARNMIVLKYSNRHVRTGLSS